MRSSNSKADLCNITMNCQSIILLDNRVTGDNLLIVPRLEAIVRYSWTLGGKLMAEAQPKPLCHPRVHEYLTMDDRIGTIYIITRFISNNIAKIAKKSRKYQLVLIFHSKYVPNFEWLLWSLIVTS